MLHPLATSELKDRRGGEMRRWEHRLPLVTGKPQLSGSPEAIHLDLHTSHDKVF